MAVVYLALGSNVGDTKGHLKKAEELLCETLDCTVSAPLYASKAVGYTDQADFLNTVVCGQTTLSPEELLQLITDIEVKVGRTKTFRWGPREIDIDIIFYDDVIMNQPGLTIPHPHFFERDFVLRPMCDLNPDFVDPRSKKSIKTLLDNLPKSQRSIL